jgi:hypothetical protein
LTVPGWPGGIDIAGMATRRTILLSPKNEDSQCLCAL